MPPGTLFLFSYRGSASLVEPDPACTLGKIYRVPLGKLLAAECELLTGLHILELVCFIFLCERHYRKEILCALNVSDNLQKAFFLQGRQIALHSSPQDFCGIL